jgi:uncharacterized protein (DUF302 family)
MLKQLGFIVELPLSFAPALTRVRAALKQEGFGVLTRSTSVRRSGRSLARNTDRTSFSGRATRRSPLRPSPPDPSVGLLLPCNVTVEWLAEERTSVRLTDPEALLSTVVLQEAPDLKSVARDARERMLRVAESLAKG